MAIGQGYTAVMGAGEEAGVYGTAAAVLATNLIPVESEALERTFARIQSDILRGEAGRRVDAQGNQTVGGTVGVTLMYDKLNSTGGRWYGGDMLLALALGTASHSTGTTTLTPAETSTGLFTMAINKGVSVWQFRGGKIDNFRLMGNKDEPLKAEFDTQFYDLNRGSTYVNTAATLATLNGLFTTPAYIRHRDLVFRIGDLADALSTADVKQIDEWTLEVNKNLAGDDYRSGSKYALEPVQSGFREVAFSINLPRYDADTFIGWLDADTGLQADLTYTSSTSAFKIKLHTLKVTGFGAPVAGPDTVRQRVDFIACLKSTANTYSTGLKEFAIYTENQRTASPI